LLGSSSADLSIASSASSTCGNPATAARGGTRRRRALTSRGRSSHTRRQTVRRLGAGRENTRRQGAASRATSFSLKATRDSSSFRA
jgi:hypothetical protein